MITCRLCDGTGLVSIFEVWMSVSDALSGNSDADLQESRWDKAAGLAHWTGQHMVLFVFPVVVCFNENYISPNLRL